MKKFFLTLFFACGIFFLLSQGKVLWSKFGILDAPRVHKVQKGESLSKLAQQYYGDPHHWRELALVNRAPKPNHLEVGEEILLPSEAVIDELHRSRTVTRVNTLVGELAKMAVRTTPESTSSPAQSNAPAINNEPAAPVETPTAMSDQGNHPVPEITPETLAPQTETQSEGAGFPWFWLAIGVIIIAGVAGFVWYRGKQAEEAEIEMVEPHRNFDSRSPRPSFNQSAKDNRGPFGKSERETEHVTV